MTLHDIMKIYHTFSILLQGLQPGHVAQSVGHLTRKSEVLGSIPAFVSPSADLRGTVVSFWRKYVHEVLVNRSGGLSLPRKSVVRLTGHPNMTLDVYRGRKTTTPTYQGLHVLILAVDFCRFMVPYLSEQTHMK